MTAVQERRLREFRSRMLVRAFDHRQRRHARVWFRLRRVLTFASEAYSAAKAGIVGLTRRLAKRFGPAGVRVNCIAPGVIKTPRLRYSGSDEPEFARRVCKLTPLGRLGTAEEVASLVLFLASDQSSYITGQDIAIDGGFSVAPMFETASLP